MSAQTAVFVATAVVLPLLLSEFGDWCPWLAKRLARWTARRLGDRQAIDRYSEEWVAELAEVPGKLSQLVAAVGYVAALPQIRWTLRAQHRAQEEAPRLEHLLPSGLPAHWTGPRPDFLHHSQSEAFARLMHIFLESPRSLRDQVHVLIAPPGCGKTVTCMAIYEELQRSGKEVHYVYQPRWADGPGRGPWRMNADLRDLFVRASERVGLLIIDEADMPTIEAMTSLHLRCPVLVVGRPEVLDDDPTNVGVVMQLGPSDGWMPFGLRPPVSGQD